MTISQKERSEWTPTAACRHSDPKDFDVPVNMSAPLPDSRIEAMWAQGTICESCPVVARCAKDSLTERNIAVVRGGVPIAENARAELRALERAALREVAEGADVAAVREKWSVAVRRQQAKRRTERKAA